LAIQGNRRPSVVRVLAQEYAECGIGLGVTVLSPIGFGLEELRIGRPVLFRVVRKEGAEVFNGGLVILCRIFRRGGGEEIVCGSGGRIGNILFGRGAGPLCLERRPNLRAGSLGAGRRS
jgi:hypothetical protein